MHGTIIYLANNTALHGRGVKWGVITNSAPSLQGWPMSNPPNYNITLRNFTINSNSHNQTLRSDYDVTVYLNSVIGFTIEGVILLHSLVCGIELENCIDGTITGCALKWGTDGIATDSGCENIRIAGNTFLNLGYSSRLYFDNGSVKFIP